MKAIETRYIGPTNTRGSRLVATAEGGNRVTLSYDYELNSDQNHEMAAYHLMAKLDWTGEMVGGHTAKGMVWVFVDGPRVKRMEL